MQTLKAERGQALVEFALILPILLAIIIGIFDFGSAYNQKNDLNFLANQAARYASVNACAPCTPGPNAIKNYVTSTADTNHLQTTMSITFCRPDGSGAVGHPVRVSASAPYNWLGVLASSGLPAGTITIKSTVTTRILQADDGTLYTAAGSC